MSWNFDPVDLKITNSLIAGWEIDLRQISNKNDLLFWLLQAAKHNFDMKGLLDTLLVAGNFCFGTEAANGAVLLQDIYKIYPPSSNDGPVDWINGKFESVKGNPVLPTLPELRA